MTTLSFPPSSFTSRALMPGGVLRAGRSARFEKTGSVSQYSPPERMRKLACPTQRMKSAPLRAAILRGAPFRITGRCFFSSSVYSAFRERRHLIMREKPACSMGIHGFRKRPFSMFGPLSFAGSTRAPSPSSLPRQNLQRSIVNATPEKLQPRELSSGPAVPLYDHRNASSLDYFESINSKR